MKDALDELLRRCHRDELLPMADALAIRPAGMDLATLAAAISGTLRRRAANDLENIVLRGGGGPAYGVVLRRVGRRLGITVPEHDPEEAEQQIVVAQLRRTWDAIPEDERERRWTAAHGALPVPEAADEALAQLEANQSRSLGYRLGQLVSEPTVPIPGVMFVAWLMRPRFERVLPAILEIARLRQVVRHRVTIGVVGSPSSGKDAAIAALFGLHTGNVNPVAGSTRAVEILQVPGPTALYVVNTPGLGDVVHAVTEHARQVLDHIDVYVYLVNAQGGVQAREKADYDACRAKGRPVLAVINKIDTLREVDRARYLLDARTKLGAPEADFLAAAFDPLPQLANAPIGVDAVRRWVAEHLARLGKDPAELPWLHADTRVVR